MGISPAIGNPREISPVIDESLYSREVRMRCNSGKFMSREGESRGSACLHLFLAGSSFADNSCKCWSIPVRPRTTSSGSSFSLIVRFLICGVIALSRKKLRGCAARSASKCACIVGCSVRAMATRDPLVGRNTLPVLASISNRACAMVQTCHSPLGLVGWVVPQFLDLEIILCPMLVPP